MIKTGSIGTDAFAALKRLAQRPAPAADVCALCSVGLALGHRHLVEPQTRRLVCACTACALLFEAKTAGRYRLVPRDSVRLRNFVLTDLQWEALGLPINLAFIFENSVLGKPVALYPSPAGATESLLALEAWQEIVGENPLLRRMQPDVEALLVNRINQPHRYYVAPIDRCYELAGIVRKHWKGFSGGDDVWQRIDAFFQSLEPRRAEASNA